MNIFNKIKQGLIREIIVLDRVQDDMIVDFRLARCRQCMHLKGAECEICGCFVEIKAETLTNLNSTTGAVEITHCPIGNWADLHIAELYQKK